MYATPSKDALNSFFSCGDALYEILNSDLTPTKKLEACAELLYKRGVSVCQSGAMHVAVRSFNDPTIMFHTHTYGDEFSIVSMDEIIHYGHGPKTEGL